MLTGSLPGVSEGPEWVQGKHSWLTWGQSGCGWEPALPSSAVTLDARQDLPGQENLEHVLPSVWEPKPGGEVGAGEAPMGRACTREESGENLGPKARQEAQGSRSVLSGIPLGPETNCGV